MADDKGRNNQGGFFDNEGEDEYLSENTVVDNQVMEKLSERLKDEPEVIEEVAVAPVPPAPPITPEQKSKVEQVHSLFGQPGEPGLDVVSDEKTVILPDSELSGMPVATGAKLVVTAGPEKGKEYKIEFNEIFVGRGVDNDFVVSDPSMSRKHFRIRRRFDEYIVVDLQSGNGTRLNGEKVTEQVLAHGNEIGAGRTILRFVDLAAEKEEALAAQAAVAAPAPAPAPVAPAPVAAAPAPAPVAPAPVAAPAPIPEAPKPTPGARGNLEPVDARRGAPAPESKSSSTGMIVGIAVVVVFVVALIVWQQTTMKSAPPAPTPPVAAVQPPPPQPEPVAPPAPVDRVTPLMARAGEMVQARRFAEAIDVYNEVLAIEAANGAALEGKQNAERERANQTALAEAQQLFDAQDFDKAAIRAGQIGPDSVYHPDAQAMSLKIQDRRYAEGVEKGRAQLGNKQYDAAIASFDAVLAQKPDHAEARQFKAIAIKERDQAKLRSAADQKREEEARIAAQKERDERQRRAEEERARKAEQDRLRKIEEEKRQKADEERRRREAEEAAKRLVTGPKDLDTGLSFYKQGDLDKATGELTTIGTGRGDAGTIKKANSLVAKIKQFRPLYQDGMAAHKAKDPGKAIPKLRDAMKVDREIAAGSSYSRELPEKLADMFYLVGNMAKQKEEWDKAHAAYQRALAFFSGHAASKKGMEELSQQAEKLYYRGFALKDSDPDRARDLWKTVLKIVPKGSDLYTRTQSSLEDL